MHVNPSIPMKLCRGTARFATAAAVVSLLGCGSANDSFVLPGLSGQGGLVPPRQIVRSSVASDGSQANDTNSHSATSLLGAATTFESNASNLVPDDTNGFFDVFVRITDPAQTVRVSVASDGTQANEDSGLPSISANGTVVAFVSDASNLVPNDTNGINDIFVHEFPGRTTTRVSVSTGGIQANGQSFDPHVSADGRFVVFESDATNLVASDTNGVRDIFLHDRQTGTTSRVSTDSGGTQANGQSNAAFISGDGNFVIFSSDATDLVAGDTNGVTDIFVKNLTTGTTTRVSVDSAGAQGNMASGGFYRSSSLSFDGRFAAFDSFATNLVPGDTNNASDIFIRDLMNATTTRVSVDSAGVQGDLNSFGPVLSADGRFVSFDSAATNLVANDTNGVIDLFIHDRNAGQTVRVSLDANGVQGNNLSVFGYMSPDGTAVSFDSEASNLVPNDTNGVRDIFLAPNPLAP